MAAKTAPKPAIKRWYIIHVYSGHERKVAEGIDDFKKASSRRDDPLSQRVSQKIGEVLVPTEKQFEIQNGQRRTVEKLIFQGYVFIEMEMDRDVWFEVRRNISTVARLISSGEQPIPIELAEIEKIRRRMAADLPKHKIDYREGDVIKIIDGPFRDQEGSVAEVDSQKGKLKVLINVFGRETPMEIDALQVRRP